MPGIILHLLVVIAFLSAVCISTSPGQDTGELTGRVTSQDSGEVLTGINLTIDGTKFGATTDSVGRYLVPRIPAGIITLRVSAVGYTAVTVTGIVITAAKTTTLNLSLEKAAVTQPEVVVSANGIRSAEAAVLAERKRAPNISDGVGAEQIKRSPDVKSGDAVKRLTGISILNDKFVFIRGMADRYNETELDESPITSTEAGEKSYSFDLLPADLIESCSIMKTATPDLPGDFSGGLVELHTQEFPTENSLRISLGSGYNTVTIGKDFYRSDGGSRDWLGFDDGIRGFTGDRPDQNDIARSLPNTWAPHTQRSLPDKSLSLAFTRRVDLPEGSRSPAELGFVGNLTYKNEFRHSVIEDEDFQLDRYSRSIEDEYNVLWGAIANLSLRFGETDKIGFKNSFNQSGSDQVTVANFDLVPISENENYTGVKWTQRSSYTGQLTGEHDLSILGGMAVDWRAAVSSSHREDPDWKEAYYYGDMTDPSVPYTAAINHRSWATMSDRSRSLGIDITLPISSAKLKVGGLVESDNTSFGIRYFNVIPSQYPHPIPASLVHLPLEVIYSPENFGEGKFIFKESTRPEDTYEGDQTYSAAYGLIDVPFVLLSNRFRLVAGARLENMEQNVNVPLTTNTFTTSRIRNNDLLPSLNLTYILNDVTNLRLAYFHSVNRPEIREIAATPIYNFSENEYDVGNPHLLRSLIHNYDARVEVFPGSDELAAVSYFYKVISDPIEEFQQPGYFNYSQTWVNSSEATNRGWEIEARKSLGFLGQYLANFSVAGNYTWVQSNVDLVNRLTGKVFRSRRLQGQSPYLLNLMLLFTEPTLKTSISLLYNKFGPRTEEVGLTDQSDILEEPRDLVDLAIMIPISRLFAVKFTVANLADKDRVLTRDGRPYEHATIGRIFGMQLSASF